MIWVAKNLYFFNCLLDGAHTIFRNQSETQAFYYISAAQFSDTYAYFRVFLLLPPKKY